MAVVTGMLTIDDDPRVNIFLVEVLLVLVVCWMCIKVMGMANNDVYCIIDIAIGDDNEVFVRCGMLVVYVVEMVYKDGVGNMFIVCCIYCCCW